MQEFDNTAIKEFRNKECKYFGECYLQVRNGGKCIDDCSENNSQSKKGYWLPYIENNGITVGWICSKCKKVKSTTKIKTAYCSCCGSQMEEGK